MRQKNRHLVLALFGVLVFACLFVGVGQVQADYIVSGVYSDTPPTESTRPEVVSPETSLVLDRLSGSQRPLESPGGASRRFIEDLNETAFIDFDDVTAPCLFTATQALRDEYAAVGVAFEGPGPLDGGAILDECGGFDVTGHSIPNFLAFNSGLTLSTGGIPRGPETMHFDPAVNYVQFLAGNRDGGTLTAEAYDALDNLIASDSITMQPELQPVILSASGIIKVVVSCTDNVWVIDDLTFVQGDVSGNVLWDLYHGVYLDYEPAGRYSNLVSLLATSGFSIDANDSGVLALDLNNYDIIVINVASAWDSAYSTEEITAITNFVNNGGGLLILGDNAGCPNANINPLAQAYGTTLGLSNVEPLDTFVTDFTSHPIFNGVSELYMRAAGEIDGTPPSEEVSWYGSLPLVAIASEGGNVAMLGEFSLWENIYIDTSDNQLFAINTFRWLLGGEWYYGPSLNYARYGLDVVEHNGKIYAIGGSYEDEKLEVLDTDSGSWVELQSLPTGQELLAAALVGNKIYTMGDYGPDVTCQIYDIGTDTWESGPDIPIALQWATAEAIGDKIYLIGGFAPGALNTLYILDTVSNEWSQGSNMPSAIQIPASAVYGNQIYVFGTGQYYKYDVATDFWSLFPGPPSGHGYAAETVTVGGKIYLIGGNVGYVYEAFKTVEIYDPVSQTWAEGPELNIGRYQFGASYSNGKIYAIGGRDENGEPLSSVEIYDVPQATYGDELAVDFGSSGLWHHDGSTWTQLNGQNPEGMEEWNGGLASDFAASGLWNYDGSSWNLLTTLDPEAMKVWDDGLAVDFSSTGLWNYNGSSWDLLTTNDPQDMESWANGLAVDFGTFGLWNYNGSSWDLLTTSDAQDMRSWTNGLAVDFGTFGLWNYNGSSWDLLTTNDAEGMEAWSGGLAVDFDTFGLWNYNGSSWGLLTTSNAELMAAWANGIAVDFGGTGLWSYDGSSWDLLTTSDAQDMEGWATSLAVDLGASGLWNYDGSSWESLTGLDSEDIIDVDLY